MPVVLSPESEASPESDSESRSGSDPSECPQLRMRQISLAILCKRIVTVSLSALTPTAHHRYCELEPECRLRVGEGSVLVVEALLE